MNCICDPGFITTAQEWAQTLLGDMSLTFIELSLKLLKYCIIFVISAFEKQKQFLEIKNSHEPIQIGRLRVIS